MTNLPQPEKMPESIQLQCSLLSKDKTKNTILQADEEQFIESYQQHQLLWDSGI
ncbi:hypothetical protein OCHUTO_0160 [Orientia chuto str. Dubai]|uniref:Uncharacterized protein n=1 Tax=Orientia chuto str. Dubai TaxID=1359168 RepID=A0A0F3MP26_9RICK|nr:hypothetical protein [Candidatus Orientia mediorientalis]KJV57192.1 hypothetical protein OCHUTO_0160 [Orientia chuto str. Dubai]